MSREIGAKSRSKHYNILVFDLLHPQPYFDLEFWLLQRRKKNTTIVELRSYTLYFAEFPPTGCGFAKKK